MHLIISVLIAALGFFLGAQLLKGVTIKNYVTALLIVLVIAILNLTLGTFLKIISLGILSFGIFKLLLGALLILVADWFLDDFKVANFWWALGLATFVAVFQALAGALL